MIRNDYPLGFRTSLHLKDLGIALAMAKELGVNLVGFLRDDGFNVYAGEERLDLRA